MWPLHWPVVNSPHMEEKLGRREMEQKRKEDAIKYELEDPSFMPQQQLKEARRFREAALRAYGRSRSADPKVRQSVRCGSDPLKSLPIWVP